MQPTTCIDCDMTEPLIVACPQVTAAVLSRRCPGHDCANEDAAMIAPTVDDGVVLAIADGMGGARDGARASSITIDALAKSVGDATSGNGHLRKAIIDGVENANRDVLELGTGGATTLAIVEVQQGIARLYNIGDSMVLIVGQRGKIKQQSIAHSPVGLAVEAGHLDEDDAMHHEDRNLVSNMVGDAGMRIEIGSPLKLSARDTILIGSDGLFDNLTIAEIIAIIRKGPLHQGVLQLAQLAQQRMTDPQPGQPCKPDDLTIIACRKLGN